MFENLDIAEFKYLIASEKDKLYGLSVNTVGFQSIQPGSIYPLANHPSCYLFCIHKGRVLDEYQLVYITKGYGQVRINSMDCFQVSEGQVIVLFPGQWHSYCPAHDSGWNEYYIGFCGKIADSIIQNSFLSKENQLLNVGLNEELVSLFNRAVEIVKTDKIGLQQHLVGIVMHVVGLICYESRNKEMNSKNSNDTIKNAKIIMRENVCKNLHPEELSAELNINYTTFRKLFKANTGFSPAKYFQHLKIQKAKQLLLESTFSIKEISYMLNFYSPEYFNISFKRIVGQAPSKYRSDCITGI